MRHTGAGLAIPDFPLNYGRLLPPIWTQGIALNFAHRVGALIVTILIFTAAWKVRGRHADHPELTRPAALLVLLVLVQVTLGASVILTRRQPVINTAHVATGALVLVTSLFLTLRTFRVRLGWGVPRVAAAPAGIRNEA
jgi:cytochrome c oxidase assembly protein subunit 15